MKENLKKRFYFKVVASWAAALALIFAVTLLPVKAEAGMKSPPPEKIKTIIIGDRVVDIAFNLGVIPEAMSVRGSLWPMAKRLKTASQMLGCPRCVSIKKQVVPNACKKMGISRIIVEKSDPFCLYMPKVKPENIVPIMEKQGVKIEFVDFSAGLEQAVLKVGRLVGREAKAEVVIERYKKDLAAAKTKLPARKLGNKVIILSGTYQPSTGKCLLRVEAPGGYSDRFLLGPLGCVNVGDCFMPAGGKTEKGHYLVRKTRKGMDLAPIIKANPDVIVMTGDAFAVQKTIRTYSKEHPEIMKVKAVKEMALYNLPFYADSGVLEYPVVLLKWIKAFAG